MPYIFDIQHFSIHDGPGIRTTVFFKGCPLACAWCHNPESRSFAQEYWENHSSRTPIGKQYTVRALVKEIEKDRIFYEQSGGGVTLSGGEVMAQKMDYIEELVRTLHRAGISVAIDTCGYCDFERFERVLPFVDLFLYDLKLLDNEQHQHYTTVSNKIILENLKKLSARNARIFLRLIMLEGINTDNEHIENLHNFLIDNKIKAEKIDLLPYHQLGRHKYQRLSAPAKVAIFKPPTAERLQEIKEFLQ